MNHNCHGDWWPRLKVYRCLLDGTLIRRDDPPKTCPACGRNAEPIVDLNARLERYEIAVIYASDGSVFELDRHPVVAKAATGGQPVSPAAHRGEGGGE